MRYEEYCYIFRYYRYIMYMMRFGCTYVNLLLLTIILSTILNIVLLSIAHKLISPYTIMFAMIFLSHLFVGIIVFGMTFNWASFSIMASLWFSCRGTHPEKMIWILNSRVTSTSINVYNATEEEIFVQTRHVHSNSGQMYRASSTTSRVFLLFGLREHYLF